ncbi:Vesicular inhibitory amino acid transporter, partial [Smittium culicis]
MNHEASPSSSNQAFGNNYGSIEEQPLIPTKIHGKSSNWDTFLQISCILLGTGVLQLPAALKEGGWIGIFYILLAGVISNYTGMLTVRCLYHKEGSRVKTFSELGRSAFGNRGLLLVKFMKNFALISAGAIFILLAAINLNALSKLYFGFGDNIKLWVTISSILVFIPMLAFKELHESPSLSFFGTFTTVFVIIIVTVLSIIKFFEKDFVLPPSNLFSLKGFPISLSSICFAFGGNLLWPEVEEGMRDPKSFERVLTLSNGVVTLFYVTVALTAYLVFGDNVLSPVLLSFEPSFFLDASYMLIALHVLLTAPMLLMSVSNEIEKDISTSDSENSESRFFTRSVLRGVIIIIASTTVVSLPNFEKLVSFFGSMTSSILSF